MQFCLVARRRRESKPAERCDIPRLLAVVEKILHIPNRETCSSRKNPRLIYAKEVLIASARRLGCSLTEIADALDVDPSTVTRRHDAVRRKMTHNEPMALHVENVVSPYR